MLRERIEICPKKCPYFGKSESGKDCKHKTSGGFEGPPFPYVFYSPYPKGPPIASGTGIPKIIICPFCQEKYKLSEKSCSSCGYKFFR